MQEYAVSKGGQAVSLLDLKVHETAVIAYDQTVSPSGLTLTDHAVTASGHPVSVEDGTGPASSWGIK